MITYNAPRTHQEFWAVYTAYKSTQRCDENVAFDFVSDLYFNRYRKRLYPSLLAFRMHGWIHPKPGSNPEMILEHILEDYRLEEVLFEMVRYYGYNPSFPEIAYNRVSESIQRATGEALPYPMSATLKAAMYFNSVQS